MNVSRLMCVASFVLSLLPELSGGGGGAFAQAPASLGVAAPAPGPDDISQVSILGNRTAPDGLNYYTDNNPPVGQTFTTGPNATRLTSLAIKTAGLNSGGGYGTPATTPTYFLRIYSISGNTATFLIAFSAAIFFAAAAIPAKPESAVSHLK